MKNNRWIWVGLAIVVIALMSLVVAPQSAQLHQGSTYSRAPSGYGAWYAYMQERSPAIQRWERPLSDLLEPDEQELPVQKISAVVRSPQLSPIEQLDPAVQPPAIAQSPSSDRHRTLVQINFGWDGLGVFDRSWVAQGNVLVLVGMRRPVTAAPFRSALSSSVGAVQIETRRRHQLSSSNQALLADEFGAVAWQERIGAGKVIYVATPHLAANAYQEQPGNFAFLAQLVSDPGHPIYIDEYLHGYRDTPTQQPERRATLGDYLLKTPILLLAIQIGLLLLVAIWGQNQRLGPALPLVDPPVDNSTAYIEALGSVLHQAHSPQFVVETIGKAEQQQIQRALGLGTAPVEPAVLIAAWTQQTGQSAEILQAWLDPLRYPRPLGDRALQTWLDQLQTIRRQLDRST